MKQAVKIFVEKYLNAISENNAAIFAGAGLSVPAGFVNWKELLRKIAEELELDIDKEDDLISIAQYYVNQAGGQGAINQTIVNAFSKGVALTPNLKLLAKLPIGHYWTTNYDDLIERALGDANKSADVKLTPENLAITLPKRDAIVYKMHGDKSLPDKAVLTKGHYEDYNVTRQLFTTALQGDLVSKTFLFIGFSFEDPNLSYILSRIRILLGNNQRDHYCFFKQPQLSDYKKKLGEIEGEKAWAYDCLKLNYKVRDLTRYSIKALLIDDYAEITDTLTLLNKKLKRKKIFISGAVANYGTWGKDRTDRFVFDLSYKIAASNYKIISGFGLGIGDTVINGALTYLYTTKYQHLDEVIAMVPFPRFAPDGVDIKELKQKHREELTAQSGISIFIFGNKYIDGVLTESPGMMIEFDAAWEHDKNRSVPIPIGATGNAAKIIWDIVNADPTTYGYDTPELLTLLQKLNDETATSLQLIDTVMAVIGLLQ